VLVIEVPYLNRGSASMMKWSAGCAATIRVKRVTYLVPARFIHQPPAASAGLRATLGGLPRHRGTDENGL